MIWSRFVRWLYCKTFQLPRAPELVVVMLEERGGTSFQVGITVHRARAVALESIARGGRARLFSYRAVAEWKLS